MKGRNPSGFGRQISDKVGVDPVDNREVVSLKKLCSSQIFGSVADLPGIRIQDKWHLKVGRFKPRTAKVEHLVKVSRNGNSSKPLQCLLNYQQ